MLRVAARGLIVSLSLRLKVWLYSISFLGKPCPNNCFEENEQGTCNSTTGICACNPDVTKYKYCGPDCNLMYQHCVIYCKNNECPDWIVIDEYAYLYED